METETTVVCSAVVVDDNADNADLLAAVLQLRGLRVFVAYSAQDAIRLAETHQPTAVISDIEMPEMDGLVEAALLRSLYGDKICLIAVSGAPHLRERARAAGYDHYLIKPVDPAVLEELVRSA